MHDFLWFPIGILCGIVVYHLGDSWTNKWTNKRDANRSTKVLYQDPSASSSACVRIVDITLTNNSYDPMGDVLSELDLERVQTILGKELHADMGGYMR